MPASRTASFLYAQPVLAMLVAWVWQGVVPGLVTLAGGALALAGVVVVQTKGRPKDETTGLDRSGPRTVDLTLPRRPGV
jgi:drug/metabolite transporter (DMT)-like permease